MGCLDKVGGILLGLLYFILGFGLWVGTGWAAGLAVIIGSIIFVILTMVTEPDDYLSFLNQFDTSPFSGLICKILANTTISGIAAGVLFCIFTGISGN